jgi:hypothetical protein
MSEHAVESPSAQENAVFSRDSGRSFPLMFAAAAADNAPVENASAEWLRTSRELRDGQTVHLGHCRACGSDWTIGEHWDPMKVLGPGRHRVDCPAVRRLQRAGMAHGAARSADG